MDSSEKLIGAGREFLNQDLSVSLDSHIAYHIKTHTWDKRLIEEGLHSNATISFSIADCDRVIRLDFAIYEKSELRNSLYKINTLMEVLTNFKKDLLVARGVVVKGQKRLKELEVLTT